MARESRAPAFLVALSLMAAMLGLVDLLEAVLGGFTLVVGQVIGAAIGWLAYRRGAPRWLSLLAIGANVALLVATVVLSYIFGGT
jgi:hypothetical protein